MPFWGVLAPSVVGKEIKKMKRIAYFLLAALSVVACEKSQIENGGTKETEPEDTTPSHFTFDVSEIGTGSCVLNITPDDPEKTYYWAVVEMRDLDDFGDTFQKMASSYMSGEINYYISEWGETLEDAISYVSTTGKLEDYVDETLSGNQDCIVFAAYITSDGKLPEGEKFEKYEFKTLTPAASDNKITLKIVSVEQRTVQIETETTNDDQYGVVVLPYDGYKGLTDEEIMEKINFEYKYTLSLVEGNITADNDNSYYSKFPIKAGKEYLVAAFGVESWCSTTSLTKTTFTSPQTGDPKDFTITAEFSEGPVNGYQLNYTITPSDPAIDYIYTLVPADYSSEKVTEDCNKNVDERAASIGAPRPEFLEFISYYGEQAPWTPDCIIPGRSYKVAVIPVNVETGEFYKNAVFSEVYEVPVPEKSTASVEVSFTKYYDRDAIVALDSNYEYLGGGAVFTPTVTTSENAASYYYYPFKYDGPDAFTHDQIIRSLIENGVTYSTQNFVDYDADAVIYAVAVDEEGNCGDLFEYVFKLSKSGASPAQEFIDEMNSMYMYSASAKATKSTASKAAGKPAQYAGCALPGPVQF